MPWEAAGPLPLRRGPGGDQGGVGNRGEQREREVESRGIGPCWGLSRRKGCPNGRPFLLILDPQFGDRRHHFGKGGGIVGGFGGIGDHPSQRGPRDVNPQASRERAGTSGSGVSRDMRRGRSPRDGSGGPHVRGLSGPAIRPRGDPTQRHAPAAPRCGGRSRPRPGSSRPRGASGCDGRPPRRSRPGSPVPRTGRCPAHR